MLIIFSQYFRPYSLDFSSLYIHENALKNLFRQILYLRGYSSNFNLFSYSDSPFLCIFMKTFWKIYGNKILYFKLFCYSDFPFLYIFTKISWKFYESKILCLCNFWVILSYFVAHIFSSYIFTKTFWNIFANKYCI